MINLALLTEDEKELFEERSAIKEYCGNMSRLEAEQQAFEEILLARSLKC